MTRNLKLSLALAVLAFTVPASSIAASFTDVYFLGDSLSDTGNNGPVDVGPVLPGTYGYDPDRWTNAGGTLWSEGFSAGLGFGGAAVASSDGGHNYAAGGQRADQLSLQISALSADEGGTLSSTALYAIWSGGNDLLQGESAASTVTDVINSILSLSVLGAENFLVLNMVDYSQLAPGTGPLAGTLPIPAGADIWATDFNNGLSSSIASLSGVTVYEFDVASLINGIFADPTGNGYAAGLAPCSLDANCVNGIDTDNFVMMDHVHLMSGPSSLVATGALAVIPEPSTALLLGLGLAAIGLRRKR